MYDLGLHQANDHVQVNIQLLAIAIYISEEVK